MRVDVGVRMAEGGKESRNSVEVGVSIGLRVRGRRVSMEWKFVLVERVDVGVWMAEGG